MFLSVPCSKGLQYHLRNSNLPPVSSYKLRDLIDSGTGEFQPSPEDPALGTRWPNQKKTTFCKGVPIIVLPAGRNPRASRQALCPLGVSARLLRMLALSHHLDGTPD